MPSVKDIREAPSLARLAQLLDIIRLTEMSNLIYRPSPDGSIAALANTPRNANAPGGPKLVHARIAAHRAAAIECLERLRLAEINAREATMLAASAAGPRSDAAIQQAHAPAAPTGVNPLQEATIEVTRVFEAPALLESSIDLMCQRWIAAKLGGSELAHLLNSDAILGLYHGTDKNAVMKLRRIALAINTRLEPDRQAAPQIEGADKYVWPKMNLIFRSIYQYVVKQEAEIMRMTQAGLDSAQREAPFQLRTCGEPIFQCLGEMCYLIHATMPGVMAALTSYGVAKQGKSSDVAVASTSQIISAMEARLLRPVVQKLAALLLEPSNPLRIAAGEVDEGLPTSEQPGRRERTSDLLTDILGSQAPTHPSRSVTSYSAPSMAPAPSPAANNPAQDFSHAAQLQQREAYLKHHKLRYCTKCLHAPRTKDNHLVCYTSHSTDKCRH